VVAPARPGAHARRVNADEAPDRRRPRSVYREGTEPDARFTLANERTFLAWIRTALGLMTAGLAITQLLPEFDFAGGRRLIGLPLIAVGVVMAITSYWQWQKNERAMRLDEPLPTSYLPRIVAVVVGVCALIGGILVVFSGR
jgi:putative membrane protein